MPNGLGQLPNAPLIYVLAQIIFDRVPRMDSHWENFHQGVFDDYPEFKPGEINKLSITGDKIDSSKERHWNLFSRDTHNGLILGANSLIFHTTAYETSDKFFNNLKKALMSLADTIPSNVNVQRLGLRYVDLLLPHKTLSVDKQIVNQIDMLDLSEIRCESIRYESVARYRTEKGGELNFRHRQTTGTDILPPDLFPNDLSQAALLKVPKPDNEIVGLLDYDHFVSSLNMPFHPDTIIEKISELHQTTSDVFKVTTTDEAMKIWEKS